MTNEVVLQEIFDQVLEIHRSEFSVDDDEIKEAISEMHYVYSKKGQLNRATRKPINYNNPAHRCAYLFKYAAIHTALVQHVLLKFYLPTNRKFLQNRNSIETCCLGGGPGTDVLGIASVLFSLNFGFRLPSFNFTVIDCMSEWQTVFETLIEVAGCGLYRSLDKFLTDQVNCFYICDNILNAGQETKNAVESADIITMVKFVSAANPKGIPAMLKRLFTWMKPGAQILFIDSACGGFYEKVAQAASDCGLKSESGPQRHMQYEKDIFENYGYGHFSLCSVRVAVQMWQKPLSQPSPVIYRAPVPSRNCLEMENCLPAAQIPATTKNYPDLREQIFRELLYGDANLHLGNSLLPPYRTQPKPSARSQFAYGRSSFRNATTTTYATDRVYKHPDETRLFKVEETKVCQVNQTNKKDSWCTIL